MAEGTSPFAGPLKAYWQPLTAAGEHVTGLSIVGWKKKSLVCQ